MHSGKPFALVAHLNRRPHTTSIGLLAMADRSKTKRVKGRTKVASSARSSASPYPPVLRAPATPSHRATLLGRVVSSARAMPVQPFQREVTPRNFRHRLLIGQHAPISWCSKRSAPQDDISGVSANGHPTRLKLSTMQLCTSTRIPRDRPGKLTLYCARDT